MIKSTQCWAVNLAKLQWQPDAETGQWRYVRQIK